MRIVHVVGARPNFMKIAPIMAALDGRNGVEQVLVHTGQHYDEKMSTVFFEELGMPRPDFDLGVGSGSHGAQTGKVMIEFEKVLMDQTPDAVVVVGDVNSTVAAAIVTSKLNIPCAHVEAGLRSGDRSMPEEINRLLTDRIADLLLTPSPDADENLLKEGIEASRIHLVGNVMIDTLLKHLPLVKKRKPIAAVEAPDQKYALMTLHRPSNVDDKTTLQALLSAFDHVQSRIPLVFPMHPRTEKSLKSFGLWEVLQAMPAMHIVEPLGYLDFLSLSSCAAFVLTDSGGLQEETTALGIPCLTMRPNTERPITSTEGTNTLVGSDPAAIIKNADAVLDGNHKKGSVPELWDGRTGERIANVLLSQ